MKPNEKINLGIIALFTVVFGYTLIERVTRDEQVYISTMCEEDSVLEEKVGFSYSVDLTEVKIRDTNFGPDPLSQLKKDLVYLFPRDVGSKYEFKIEEIFGNPMEYLVISNYGREKNPTLFPTSMIHIRACDGVKNIRLSDLVNDTNISLQLQPSGKITTDGMPIGPEIAKKLFEQYAAVFDRFKEEYDIDPAIARYTQKMEIEIVPP